MPSFHTQRWQASHGFLRGHSNVSNTYSEFPSIFYIPTFSLSLSNIILQLFSYLVHILYSFSFFRHVIAKYLVDWQPYVLYVLYGYFHRSSTVPHFICKLLSAVRVIVLLLLLIIQIYCFTDPALALDTTASEFFLLLELARKLACERDVHLRLLLVICSFA